MAKYTLDEVMGGKKKYSLDEVLKPNEALKPSQSGLDAEVAGMKAVNLINQGKLSKLDKIKMGFGDQGYGIEQFLDKVSPDVVKDAVGGADKFLYENTKGVMGKLPGAKGIDQRIREREAEYQKKRGPDAGFDGYRTLGNVVNPINYIPAAKIPAATSLLGRMGLGGLTGAALSSTNPVIEEDFWEGKRNQAGLGLIAGGAVPIVMGGLSRIISPNSSRNADLNLLKKEGVKPTVGQTLGGNWNKAEEKMTSVPIMGDFVNSARGRAQKDFNEAAINRASGKVGVKVEGTGHDAVKEAADAISVAYTKALDQIKSVKFDDQFAGEVNQLKEIAKKLTPSMRTKFNKELNERVGERFRGTRSMDGGTYKQVDSELGKIAARWKGSPDAAQKDFGDAIFELKKSFHQAARRSNPQALKGLDAADEAYANLVRVEGAAKGSKATDGLFTPGRLNTAIGQADDTIRDRGSSHGTALMQDLGRAGQKVLGNKVPNSFTADRALYAGGGLGAGVISPMIPAGLLAGSAAYTAPGQSLLRGLVNSRPDVAQPIGQAIRKFSPLTVPAAAQSANEEMDNLFNRRR